MYIIKNSLLLLVETCQILLSWVTVSQGIFQHELDKVYTNILNVTDTVNDILGIGSKEKDHDEAFTDVLEATCKNNFSLNSGKLQCKQLSIPYCGNTLTGKNPASSRQTRCNP